MRYASSAAFTRSLKALSPERRRRVTAAVQRFVTAIEAGDAPHGLGMKQLQHGYWECRAGLADRIIVYRERDLIAFVLTGNHDDIRRFLRRT